MELKKDLLVIGYYNGKALIKDELDHLFFLECGCNEAPIGTIVEENGLKPISELAEEEQQRVSQLF